MLVAEIETREAFAGLYAIQNILAMGLLVTLIVAVVLSLLFSNLFVRPIITITKQMAMQFASKKGTGGQPLSAQRRNGAATLTD
jgi:preprotein translocase subunit SecY